MMTLPVAGRGLADSESADLKRRHGPACASDAARARAVESLEHERVAARLYKLLPASADQSRRPDMIEFGDLHALALPRDKLAVATAR